MRLNLMLRCVSAVCLTRFLLSSVLGRLFTHKAASRSTSPFAII
jgi:hypothetical protein